jgi:hypothetical protein
MHVKSRTDTSASSPSHVVRNTAPPVHPAFASPPTVSASLKYHHNGSKNGYGYAFFAYPSPLPPAPPLSVESRPHLSIQHSCHLPQSRRHPTVTGTRRTNGQGDVKSGIRHPSSLPFRYHSNHSPSGPSGTCITSRSLDVTQRSSECAKKAATGTRNHVPVISPSSLSVITRFTAPLVHPALVSPPAGSASLNCHLNGHG